VISAHTEVNISTQASASFSPPVSDFLFNALKPFTVERFSVDEKNLHLNQSDRIGGQWVSV
jgi:hypothetical protein